MPRRGPALFDVDQMQGGAVISPCGVYRYRLQRLWGDIGENRRCNFILLNPSTADANTDDPTVRRCRRYAQRWGYDALVITNLFALRATDPRELKRAADPIGPDNDEHLLDVALGAAMVVLGWGNHGAYRSRGEVVYRMLREAGVKPHALQLTGSGVPGHPLYLRGDLEPFVMEVS